MTNPDPGELTDAAKAEIAAAIRIVREDKFEAFARERLSRHTDPPKPADPPKPTDPPTPTPPPAVPPTGAPEGSLPAGPPVDAPVKRKSLYWGDLDE